MNAPHETATCPFSHLAGANAPHRPTAPRIRTRRSETLRANAPREQARAKVLSRTAYRRAHPAVRTRERLFRTRQRTGRAAALLLGAALLVLGAALLCATLAQEPEYAVEGADEFQTEMPAPRNGAPIERLASSPTSFCDNVEPVLQGDAYPSGCEPAALACALSASNVPTCIEDVIGCLDTDPKFRDFVHHYAGDPAGDGAAWPPAMVDAANRYLAKAGIDSLSAADISGTSFSDVMRLTQAGYPVLVWTTVDMESPDFSNLAAFGQRFVRNNHCVVVHGQDASGNVLVMDPLEGCIARDAEAFARIYEQRGCLAMVICQTSAIADDSTLL